MPPVFDLGLAEQSVSLAFQGKPHTHFFSAPHPDVAFEYLDKIYSKQRTVDFKTFEPEHDSTDADLFLWASCCVRVEGYVSRQWGNIMEPATVGPSAEKKPDWKTLVPASHKQAFARALYTVGVSKMPEREFFDDDLVVVLSALQNNVLIQHLSHVFKFPGARELKNWNRLKGASKIEVTKSATTLYTLNRSKQEAAMYDQLIQKVENYSHGGVQLLTSNDAAGMMSPVHKSFAITALFASIKGDADEDLSSPLEAMPSGTESEPS